MSQDNDWQPLNLNSEPDSEKSPSTWDDWINRLIDRSPHAPAIRGWVDVFTVFSCTSVMVLVVSWLIRPASRPSSAEPFTWEQAISTGRFATVFVLAITLTPLVLWGREQLTARKAAFLERGRHVEVSVNTRVAAISDTRVARIAAPFAIALCVTLLLWYLSEPWEEGVAMSWVEAVWIVVIAVVLTPLASWVSRANGKK